MRVLRRGRANPHRSGREVQKLRRAQGSRAPSGGQGILQLADRAAPLRQGRVRRRLRHHPRNARIERTRRPPQTTRRRARDRVERLTGGYPSPRLALFLPFPPAPSPTRGEGNRNLASTAENQRSESPLPLWERAQERGLSTASAQVRGKLLPHIHTHFAGGD